MIKIKYLLIFFFCLIGLHITAQDFSPETLVNPNLADRGKYVADPGNILSARAKEEANSLLWKLRRDTGVETAIVVVPTTGDYPIEDYATRLFTKWGIGKKDNDNGVLVVIATDQGEARIATGYGVEGVIPDISARKIISRSIVPHMKNGDVDGAVVAVAGDLSSILSDPVAAEELRSGRSESWEGGYESDITGEDIVAFACCVAFLVFLFSMGMYFYDSRRFGRQERYTQALGWHESRKTYILFAVLSLGLGIIPFLLAERKYRRARNKPMACPACKGKMKKLNEEEDNNLLSPSQDFEEKLNTVDYDVWVCQDCGTVERYPFRVNQKEYEECPNCHTIAMHLVRDHTVVPSTTRREGIGEKIYECKYCHNRHKRQYKIPRKDNGAGAALAAGAILGSGGRGGFGGGGFGGGFGGGSTGGGGATGRW